MSDLKKNIISVMAVVFEIDAASIPANAAPGVLEKWDSLRHMNLILALEEEFGIRFSDDEMTELISLDLVQEIIANKLKG